MQYVCTLQRLKYVLYHNHLRTSILACRNNAILGRAQIIE